MKNLKKLFLTLAVGLAAFSSCSKDEDPTTPKPTVTATAANTTVAAGSTVTITVAAMAPAGSTLSRYEVLEQSGSGAPVSLKDETVSAATKNEDFAYPVPSAASPGSTRDVIFRVTDKDGQTAEARLTITIAGGSTLNVCGTKTLGNQNHIQGSFFATGNCAVLTVSQAKASADMVDFAHYFHQSNAATIASPDDVTLETVTKFQMNTWSERRKTIFKRLAPGFKFDECNTPSAIVGAFNGGPGAAVSTIGMLAKNDVIAFKTQDGKFGIILIGNISGSAASAGTCTMTIKLQN